MRIISGKYKGKKLNQPVDDLTRPLKDMVKESIFNLIIHSNKAKINIEKAEVLDLFSGSGSFGLECISRGAIKVVFCENYQPAIKILKKNIKSLNQDKKIDVFDEDIFVKLGNKDFVSKFDLIFLDPPFKESKIDELLNLIYQSNILKKNGIVILHRNKKDNILFDKKINIIMEKVYGLSKIYFFKL
tara:strand:+ start:2090 stop:2650 length:561 start_codon:yes stop_codon:yes gene_type:complete